MSSAGTSVAELGSQLRVLLASADARTVPGGILKWLGTAAPPTGQGPAPTLSAAAFSGAYLQLENGALAPGIVRSLGEVTAATARFRPDGPLPVAIASFRYAVPSPGLVARIQAAAAAGRGLDDVPATLAGHVEERRAFFAGGLLHAQMGMSPPAYRGRTIPFLVAEEFLLGNPGAPRPDAVALDPGDGGGFRPVTLGRPLPATYPAGAPAATVAVRCRYGDQTLTASFTVPLSDRPAAPEPAQTWPLHGDCGATGTAYVYPSAAGGAGGSVSHPLIMVEGFPGGHPADFQYDTLDQQGMATELRRAGYDLILVGLHDGMDRIQRNADVLVACVREVMRRTDAPLVVGGVSMGGLVSRYGLAAMEARGEAHNCATFVTIDTPHRGTYTSLAAQWFIQALRPHLPGLAGYAAQLDSPANQQFDLWWVHDGVAGRSPLRDELLADLRALGDYPQRPRRLAIACGRGDGAREAAAGAPVLRWSGAPWVSARTWTASAGEGTIGAGSWLLADPPRLPALRADIGVTWDGAPGGQESYNGQVAALAQAVGCGAVAHALDQVCTVPTVSALDLDQDPFAPVPPPGSGAGPFHDYACAAANQPHLTLTPELTAWLLEALGDPVA